MIHFCTHFSILASLLKSGSNFTLTCGLRRVMLFYSWMCVNVVNIRIHSSIFDELLFGSKKAPQNRLNYCLQCRKNSRCYNISFWIPCLLAEQELTFSKCLTQCKDFRQILQQIFLHEKAKYMYWRAIATLKCFWMPICP